MVGIPVNYCKCGCGKKVRNMYVRGHHWRNSKGATFGMRFSEEARTNISKALMGHKISEETKKKISAAMSGEKHRLYGQNLALMWNLSEKFTGENNPNYGKSHSKETLKKMSEIKKGENNSFYGKNHTAQTKRKISDANKGRTTFQGKSHSIESKIKMSESAKKRGSNRHGKCHSIEAKLKMSERARERFTDENFLRKWVKSVNRKPNRPEKELDKILQQLFLDEYKYVGDGKVWFGGRNPDFINVNGKKKLIELFGEYWHTPEDETYRRNHFGKYGFDTLVIWSEELKNIKGLITKLCQFHDGGM